MNRLIEDMAVWDEAKDSIFKPAVELADHDDHLRLRVSVPGIDKDNIDVSVTRDTVKISGKFEDKKEDKGNGYYISELNYEEFQRTINLPVEIKNDEVTADYTDGILVLTLPKLEEATNKVFKVHLGSDTKKVLHADKN
jgi:HSP20 family protein